MMILILIVVVAVLWVLFWAESPNATNKGDTDMTDVLPVDPTVVYKVKRNNPLNIRYIPANKWKGQIGESGGFCVFGTITQGYRAAFINLRTYINGGYDTIAKIIARWAPAVENDTESYIAFVSEKTGVDKNYKVRFVFDQIAPLVMYMSKMECGYLPKLDELKKAWDEI